MPLPAFCRLPRGLAVVLGVLSGFAVAPARSTGLPARAKRLASQFERRIEAVTACAEPATASGEIEMLSRSPLRLLWTSASAPGGAARKRCGGDEYYVTLQTGSGAVAASVEDLDDGTYLFEFGAPFAGCTAHTGAPNGQIDVTLLYSQARGMLSPSRKPANVSGALNLLVHSAGLGTVAVASEDDVRTMAHVTAPLAAPAINFEFYDSIVLIGDSLAAQLLKGAPAGLQNRTSLISRQTQLLPSTLKTFQDAAAAVATKERVVELRDGHLAIIASSAAWDILEPGNDDHFLGHARALLRFLRALQRANPGASIFWREPTAMHVQKVLCGNPYTCVGVERDEVRRLFHLDPNVKALRRALDALHATDCRGNIAYDWCQQRTKCLSDSRVRLLRDIQVAVATAAGVRVLPAYSLTYQRPDLLLRGDGRHFDEEANALMWRYWGANDGAHTAGCPPPAAPPPT